VICGGFRHGAGSVLTLPYDTAVLLAKEGRVTVLIPENKNVKPVMEENDNGGT
jgi:hypothetical protein